jgi:hypothetical protein
LHNSHSFWKQKTCQQIFTGRFQKKFGGFSRCVNIQQHAILRFLFFIIKQYLSHINSFFQFKIAPQLINQELLKDYMQDTEIKVFFNNQSSIFAVQEHFISIPSQVSTLMIIAVRAAPSSAELFWVAQVEASKLNSHWYIT